MYDEVPVVVYVALSFLFTLGVILAFSIKRIKKKWRICCGVFLLCYLFLIFASTVFHRDYAENRGHNFELFWSYSAIAEGQEALLAENLLKVLVFIPIGLCLSTLLRSVKWWQVFLGLSSSALIEILPFILKRGFAEFDDVFHNVFGCMFGFGIYKGFSYLIGRIQRKTFI